MRRISEAIRHDTHAWASVIRRFKWRYLHRMHRNKVPLRRTRFLPNTAVPDPAEGALTMLPAHSVSFAGSAAPFRIARPPLIFKTGFFERKTDQTRIR